MNAWYFFTKVTQTQSDAEFRCPLQLILANLARQCASAWRLALALLSAACALLGAERVQEAR